MAARDCSAGEQKALLVGLILAQAHGVEARTGDVPLLLLDEVAAHLDSRRAFGANSGRPGGLSWITGTEATVFDGFSNTYELLIQQAAFTALVYADGLNEQSTCHSARGKTAKSRDEIARSR